MKSEDVVNGIIIGLIFTNLLLVGFALLGHYSKVSDNSQNFVEKYEACMIEGKCSVTAEELVKYNRIIQGCEKE